MFSFYIQLVQLLRKSALLTYQFFGTKGVYEDFSDSGKNTDFLGLLYRPKVRKTFRNKKSWFAHRLLMVYYFKSVLYGENSHI